MDDGYALFIRDAFWPEAGPCVLLGGNNVGTAGEEMPGPVPGSYCGEIAG
jgi:hypothetical protein